MHLNPYQAQSDAAQKPPPKATGRPAINSMSNSVNWIGGRWVRFKVMHSIAEIERLKHKPTTNLDAYDLFLRAQQLADEFTGECMAAALGYLEQALAIDSTYAAAMALAAYCRIWSRLRNHAR